MIIANLKKQRGRPKGALNKKTILKKIAKERHLAPKGYSNKYCNTGELLFLLLRQKVAEGDIGAIEKLADISDVIPPAQELNVILNFSTPAGVESDDEEDKSATG